jgi:hypothetical protein
VGAALERELAAAEASRSASAANKPEPSELLGKLCALVLEAEASGPGRLLGPYGSTWREDHSTRVESAGAAAGSRHGDSVVKLRSKALRRQIRAGRRRRTRASASVASLGSLTANLASKRGNEILSDLLGHDALAELLGRERDPPSPHTSRPPSRASNTHRVELPGAQPQLGKVLVHAAAAEATALAETPVAGAARKTTRRTRPYGGLLSSPTC